MKEKKRMQKSNSLLGFSLCICI